MATPPGYAAVSVELHHSALGRSAYLTFGADPTATDPDTMATGVNLALNTTGSLKAILDSGVSVGTITVRYGIDGQDDGVGFFQSAVVGARSLSALPPNCAVLVYKRTARGGRRGRGRMFIPWCTSTTYVGEDGVIATAEVSTLTTAVQTFYGALVTNDMPMVLLHRAGISAPGNPNAVTELSVSPLISTQRRRLGR